MTFKDYFKTQLQVEKPMGVIVRFNVKRAENPKGRYIFVEGSDDRRFYSSTDIPVFHTDLFFFSVHDDFENESLQVVGKEAVLQCFTILKSRTDIGNSFEKCVFIIDRDYDEDIEYSATKVQPDEKSRFSMTQGHSFENYFLRKDNLKTVFDYYGLSESDLEEYYRHFEAFSERAGKYYAARATITAFHNSKLSFYRPKHRNDRVFQNDILIDEGIDANAYKEEYTRMMEAINEHRECIEYYKKTKKEITQKPEMCIRGHNVYYHLEKYLLVHHRIRMRQDYKKLVNGFSITFQGYQMC